MKERKSSQKIGRKKVKTISKNSIKKPKISLSLEYHFLEDFDRISSYFGFSRTSALKQAMIEFMVKMKRRMQLIERGKKTEERWRYKEEKFHDWKIRR